MYANVEDACVCNINAFQVMLFPISLTKFLSAVKLFTNCKVKLKGLMPISICHHFGTI